MKKSLLILLFTLISSAQTKPVTWLHLEIYDAIHTGTVSLIKLALEQAKSEGAEGLLIALDTPGGRLDSTRDIVKLFLNSELPIIVYVSPAGAHAGSAGTFITMAAHVAAMAPGTNIGAAHPVSITGKDPEQDGGKHMAQKVENDTVAFIESLAKQRKRNAEWAKKAVIESASIGEEDAVKLQVVDLIAKSNEELMNAIHGRKVALLSGQEITLNTQGAQLQKVQIDPYTRFQNWLAHPSVMFMLLLVAGLGLYMEFSNPGLILPGSVGVIALILLFLANNVIPLSAIGVALVILAFALLLAEVYFSSLGLLATAGIVSFVLGAYLLFDPAVSDFRVPSGLIWGSSLALATMASIVVWGIKKVMFKKESTGQEGMLDLKGRVEVAIAPPNMGQVFVNGEYWNAYAAENLAVGESIQVIKIDGLAVHVKRV